MTEPPHDPRAEQAVLGAALLNPTVLADLGKLRAEHFYRPVHEYLFGVLQRMYSDGTAIDAMTLFSELEKDGKLQRVGGAAYLHTLLDAPSTPGNVGYYANIVAEKFKLRQLAQLGQRFVQLGNDETAIEDVPTSLEAARRFLDEVDFEDGSDDDFDSAYQSWMDWYETDTVTIPTPWIGVNQAIHGGFHRGRLYTVAGRPGAGKSAFCLNALAAAARAGYRSVAYSLEMPVEECTSRILAAGANVPLKNLFQHRLGAEETQRIKEFADQPWLRSLSIDDSPSQTIESIMADARARKQRGLDLVAIDHSLLLDPSDKSKSEFQHIGHVARYAKLLARRLDVAVILLHQLNRSPEMNDRRRPKMSDLHGGGERDADVIIILDRDGDQIIGHFVKNRMGAANQAAVMVDELAYGRLG